MVRWAELEWPGDSLPDRVTVKFAKFTLDTLLAPTLAAAAVDSATAPPP
jgi:hypothetical protein